MAFVLVSEIQEYYLLLFDKQCKFFFFLRGNSASYIWFIYRENYIHRYAIMTLFFYDTCCYDLLRKS